VLKPQQRFTFEEMVSFLKKKRIAPFKIPERLEIVQSLPLVPGGNKVDKRHLEQEIAQKLKTEGSI
jgi:non-ribosomal peptide synthetase component E (peptide arylation enzyme)